MTINYQGGNDVVVTGAFAPMMKTLQQNYLYEQEKREQVRKETNALKAQVQKEVGKINPNGLWKADLPEFNKNYEELKKLNFELSRTNDPYKTQELSMQLNEKALGLINFVQNSSETSKRYSTYLNGLPTLAGKGYVDRARAHAEQALNRPSSELGIDYFDKSKFLYPYDPTKVESAVSKVASDTLKNAPEQRTLANTVTGSGGRRTDIWNVTKRADETQVLEQLSRLAKGGNRDVQTYVEDLMSSNNVDFNTAVGMLAEEFSPKFSTQSTSETSADKPKGVTVNNIYNPFGSNTEKEQAIERNAKLFTFRDAKGNVTGEYTAPSAMALNKTQSLSGVIEGRDPYTGQRVRLDNPKNAEVFGIFEDNQGRKLMQVRITDEYGDEQVIISPNTQRINRAELSKKELQYLQGYEADIKERKSSTPQQTNNKQSSNKPKFN